MQGMHTEVVVLVLHTLATRIHSISQCLAIYEVVNAEEEPYC